VGFEPDGMVEQRHSGRSRNYRLDPWVSGLAALNLIIFVALVIVILSA
jgi:hypothetical protein